MPGKASGKKLSVRRVVRLAREEQRRSDAAVRMLVVGRGVGLQALAAAVAEAASDHGAGPAPVDVVDLGGGAPYMGAGPDDLVLVAIAGLGLEQLRGVIREAHDARAGLMVALPAEAVGPATRAALDAGAVSTELVVFEPGIALEHSRLADALAEAAGDRATAMAARLPWLRPAVVARLIRRAAMENALIGALVFIPGADMPMMTLNQIRMVLRVAAAYGLRVEPARAPEVLGVIGAGLGLRALAHQGLKLVPMAGWALKGAIGFGGTIALGRATVAYYESGAGEAFGDVEMELPEAVERRLPSPIAGLLRERLGGGRSDDVAPTVVIGVEAVSNEAHAEPLNGIQTDVDDEEGGVR